MSYIYNSFSVVNVEEISFFPLINYAKIEAINNNNQISNFRICYLRKKKPIYTIIQNSFLINRTPFKISQEESIIKFKNDIILKDIITKTVPITDKKANNINLNNDCEKKLSKTKTKSIILFSNSDKNTNIEKKNLFNINSNNTFRIKTSTNKSNEKHSDQSRFLDDRGLYISEDGSIFDNDGSSFNKDDGLDEYGGKYDRFGQYLNGKNFNVDIGMYNEDIENSLLNVNELKKEVEEKNEIEFEKIKNESINSKKLIKNFAKPFERNNSSSSDEESNFDEEAFLNDVIYKDEKEKFAIMDDMLEKEENHIYNEKEISQINKAIMEETKKEDFKIKEKQKIPKNIEPKKEKVKQKNKSIKPKKNYKKNKKSIITEESINKETDFTDIENSIFIRKILDKYCITMDDKEEAINTINELFLHYQNKNKAIIFLTDSFKHLLNIV